jgi:putative phosphoribosyl transferase
MPVFRDRSDAGRTLAQALVSHIDEDVLVLALPRGGVPVAFEVAQRLAAPLDVFLVRKLGVPGHEELAMGAIASGGIQILNQPLITRLGVSHRLVADTIVRERRELLRREHVYRDGRPPPEVADRTVILIDDGLATGSTMKAAVAGLRKLGPGRIVVAVPVGAAEACAELRAEVDEVVCLATPSPFHGVGLWYADFRQIDDAAVHTLLAVAAARAPHQPEPPGAS